MISFGLTIIRLLKAIVRSWRDPVFRSTLILAALVILSGTLFYRSVEGWSWIDSVYFSAMTATTVGYGDLAPSTPASKLFTVFYTFSSIGVVVALATQIATALIKAPREKDE